MHKRIPIRRPSPAMVVALIALFVALGPAAYAAANTVFSTDIVDGEVKTPDIAAAAVTKGKLAPNAVTAGKVVDDSLLSADVKDETLRSRDILDGSISGLDVLDGGLFSVDIADDTAVGGGLTAVDLAANSVGPSEIQTDGVQATEVASNSIDSDEIVDFGLSNQDVAVEFAQVNANGTLANSSGGVTVTKIGVGTYEVDYGHNIQSCAYVTTQGEPSAGGAGGAITGNTDRSGNAEATFTTTRTNANVLADRAFQQIVVC